MASKSTSARSRNEYILFCLSWESPSVLHITEDTGAAECYVLAPVACARREIQAKMTPHSSPERASLYGEGLYIQLSPMRGNISEALTSSGATDKPIVFLN